MKIALIERTSTRNVNKDQMGGYGIDTRVGLSFFARWIMLKKKNMRNIPVLNLAYMAAIFAKDGHSVRVMERDSIAEADLFVIASSIVDYRSELELASVIKNRFPSASVGFVGPFAAYLSDEYLKHGDFVIKGEPETAAMEISKGIIPRGVVESHYQKDLDKLDFPAWQFFNINSYSYSPTITKIPFLPMLSSRGCTFSCDYCPYLAYETKWRTRSVENITEEIRYLKERFKVKGLLFRDTIFTLDKERARNIALAIAENNFDIEWACETRTDLLDEKLVDDMYRGGLRAVNIGVESASQDLLNKAGRKAVSVNHQEKIIRYCENKGIKVISFYLLGLPDDTPETVAGTIAYAKKLNTFLAQFHVLTPFPGTKFYPKVKDMVESSDWEDFNSFTPLLKNAELSSGELLRLKEGAFVSYYFRPRYIVKHLNHLLPLWKEILLIS